MPAPATAGEIAGACKSLEFNVLIHHSFAITFFLFIITFVDIITHQMRFQKVHGHVSEYL